MSITSSFIPKAGKGKHFFPSNFRNADSVPDRARFPHDGLRKPGISVSFLPRKFFALAFAVVTTGIPATDFQSALPAECYFVRATNVKALAPPRLRHFHVCGCGQRRRTIRDSRGRKSFGWSNSNRYPRRLKRGRDSDSADTRSETSDPCGKHSKFSVISREIFGRICQANQLRGSPRRQIFSPATPSF